MLNRTKDYYKNDKELRDNVRDRYGKLSEEEKKKKRKYRRNRCHNMSEKKETKTKRISKKLS